MAKIVYDTKDLSTAGTAVQLSTLAGRYRKITYRAAVTNLGIVYIGNSDVDASTSPPTAGFPIEPGEDVTVDLGGLFQDNGLPESAALNLVYGDSTVATDDVSFVAVMIG